MNCPNCHAINDNDNLFCVNCGLPFSQIAGAETSLPPTQAVDPRQFSNQNYIPLHSTETRVAPQHPFDHSVYNPALPNTGDYQRKSGTKFVLFGAAVILILGIGGGAAFLLTKQNTSSEILPEHLGMFVQSASKDRVDEIKKHDFANAFEGGNSLFKDETLPVLDEKPSWVLYADGKDVPVNDLRLIQLDTIKDDGSLKQLDFQAAPVEGKPEMKRLRVTDRLADGKYAFALLEGYLDEGKHKFWAFQIKNSGKSDNGDALKSTTVALKPKSAANEIQTANMTAVPKNPPPAAPPPGILRVAYATTGNLVLRGGPSQSSAKIGGLYRGQKVHVISYSDNYEHFKSHYANYAYIQTEGGKRGWVYTAFLK